LQYQFEADAKNHQPNTIGVHYQEMLF